MLRFATISIFILVLFGNCKKEIPDLKISYVLKESSVDAPMYSISYTSDKSGGSTTASSSATIWNSGAIILEKNQFISMTVDCAAPLYDFVISIYVDGNLWEQRELHNPTGSITISGRP